MTYESFISRVGFITDPFASWDSDREEQLATYFVPPPYFPSVMGEPADPGPSIVFSPRGTGKSALRRMIEAGSTNDETPYLALSYIDFEWAGGKTPTVEEHQLAIARLLTLAILTELEEEPTGALLYLDAYDKNVLKTAASALLTSLTSTQYREAMAAVKSLHDKAGDAWKKYGAIVATVVGALMAKAGLDGATVNRDMVSSPAALAGGAKDLLRDLVAIARKLFWRSVYVLVDRVDETSATSASPQAAFNVISRLITSLPTLEQPGVGFKLFLWDQTEPLFMDAGGRPDRVTIHRLHWSVSDLVEMFTRRLRAHSGKTISSFNQLVDGQSDIDVHRLICFMAHGSPRDMIRISNQIIAEATRSGSDTQPLSKEDVFLGIGAFSKQRVDELFPRFSADFSRVSNANFTTPQLANDVFRITTQAMRQKILQWVEVGAVRKVGEQPTGQNRPLHIYAFSDPRIVVRGFHASTVELYLDNYLLECPQCKSIAIGSDKVFACAECGSDVDLSEARSLLQVVATAVE